MLRALVIDDAPTVRMMFDTHLKAVVPGVHVAHAESATKGMEAFAEEEYDVTFLDGVFSDGTPSSQVLASMLALRPGARVVVVSSRPREHPEIVEALGIGAYAYMQKPVKRGSVEEIFHRIEVDEGRLRRIL